MKRVRWWFAIFLVIALTLGISIYQIHRVRQRSEAEQLVDRWKADLFAKRVFVGSWDHPIGQFGFSDSLLPMFTPHADRLYQFRPREPMVDLAILAHSRGSMEAIYLLRICALNHGLDFQFNDGAEVLIAKLQSNRGSDASTINLEASLNGAIDQRGLRPPPVFSR